MRVGAELNIVTDGTGGAFAIDHPRHRVRYTQSALGSDIELLHQAVRLLVPKVYNADILSETRDIPSWQALRSLEVATCTIFILVQHCCLVEPSWQGDLRRYQDLVRRTLNWKVLPVPFVGVAPPRGSEFLAAILQALQGAWTEMDDARMNLGGDILKLVLAGTSLCEEDMLVTRALVTEANAGRDYGTKRLASFAQYCSGNPAVVALQAATDFHRTALGGAQLAVRIDDAIRKRTPFSFVRVGEGEGCFISYTKYQSRRDAAHEVFGVCAKDIYRIWFDRNIHEAAAAELEQIRNLFWKAMAAADVIGVPTPERVVFEYAHFIKDMERHGYSRGYVGVAEILSYLTQARASGMLRDILITDCDIARPLYEWQEWSSALACTLPRILKGRKDVTFVTCHPQLEPSLQRMLGISRSRTLLIPPERGRIKGDGLLAGDHFADHFQRINEELRRDPGAIVVVAAGFLGKAYCATAKAASAVAIDIGSLADFWVGVNTRAKNAWSIPSPFQITMGSMHHRKGVR